MHTLNRSFTWLLALVFALLAPLSQAQTPAPTIRTFTVDQVAQLSPGTELIFRANGTAGGALNLRIDGSNNLIGLIETRAGVYEGAYTISVLDKIPYNAKVSATLKVGERQTSATLAQNLLTNDAHAKAAAGTSSTTTVPVATTGPAITRFETRNKGVFSGGNLITFLVLGTPGASASVTMDGGATSVPLVEEKSGRYVAHYTIKTRDQLSATTQAQATLAQSDRKVSVSKTLASAALTTGASAKVAWSGSCANCGVVDAINSVKVKGTPNYVGAIAGGVAGAALGSQVGKGDGNTAATVVGAVGGALAGREIEKKVRETTQYDVVVKLNDGSSKTVRFEQAPPFNVGAKVRVDGNNVVATQ